MRRVKGRASTFVQGAAILIAMGVFAGFSLAVALMRWTVLQTCLLLPLPALVAYGLIRAKRGLPPTMRGIQGERAAVPRGRPRYQLVAMPVNHFGEKLRWTMDLLSVPYEESTVGGILSIFVRGRSVPWLVDRLSCSHIGNSDEALWYLSAVHVPTMTGDAGHRAATMLARDAGTIAWEARLNALGHALQGWAYFHVLTEDADRDLSLRLWGAYERMVPLTQRLALQAGYPLLKALMRKAFQLDDPARQLAREELIAAVLNEAEAALAQHGGTSLTGEALSYVDITFCALLGPFLPSTVLPLWAAGRFSSFAPLQDHPSMPLPMRTFEEQLRARPAGQFIETTYREHRLG